MSGQPAAAQMSHFRQCPKTCPKSHSQPALNSRQAMNSGAQVTLRDSRCFVSNDGTVSAEGISQRDGTMVIKQ